MTLENLYFPLFLVVVGVFVVWLFSRVRGSGSSRSTRRATPSKRVDQHSKLQRSLNRSGPAAGYRANHGLKTQDAMWRSRHQRASHDSSKIRNAGGDSSTFHASYIDSSRVYEQRPARPGSIGEQGVRDTEYTGIDEYLAKRAAERKAKAAAQEEELSMTAMKYEPADASENPDEEKKQAGFKP